jgi:signal peptidase II
MKMRIMGGGLIVALLLADQLSKWAVTEHLFRGALERGDAMRFPEWLISAPERLPNISVPVTSFFNLAMAWNEGISFGLMNTSGWGFLTVASILIAVFFFIWMLRARTRVEIISLALIVGGALGNVIDRVRFGAVADFLDFYWADWHFPTFNVADSAIGLVRLRQRRCRRQGRTGA